MEKSKRIYSIDVVRGTAVFLGMMMSNPGTYKLPEAFKHAAWHGHNLIDYSLPLFVIAMCMVIPIILEKELERDPKKFILRVFRRSILLFLFGLILNLSPDFNFKEVRILGVLQRLALVYFSVNLYILFLRKVLKPKSMIRALILSGLVLSILYLIILHPFGYELETNLIRRIDLKVLTPTHMYKNSPHDPEGILSTLGSIANGLFGASVGYTLRSRELSQRKKLIMMMSLGASLFILGFILKEWVPINKKMWTTSFIFYTTSAITLYTALCFFICDVKGIKKPFKFLTFMSANALFIYVARSYVMKLIWPIKIFYPAMNQELTIPYYVTYRFFTPLMGTNVEGVPFGLCYAILWVFIAWFMYKKNIFLRL